MSPPPITRDYAISRIARALGCAGYSVEECDAIMRWVEASRPAVGGRAHCEICNGSGRLAVRRRGITLDAATNSYRFEGTNINPNDIREYSRRGVSDEKLLADYPALSTADIAAAVEWPEVLDPASLPRGPECFACHGRGFTT